ncbi:hypothetical protein HanXRQr2_Chr04g0140271 [Helianthus annuus]|uniref:Uncharacterized protein n=1 Tax=Helianthus annuus TaxID=4232 RepID=A0A9K3J390_HELAN|nr:hypothetical protein HanXRQr2_Chr04g0140271 [Helianthus annuus]
MNIIFIILHSISFMSIMFSLYSTYLILTMLFWGDNYYFGGELTSESYQATYDMNQYNNTGSSDLN